MAVQISGLLNANIIRLFGLLFLKNKEEEHYKEYFEIDLSEKPFESIIWMQNSVLGFLVKKFFPFFQKRIMPYKCTSKRNWRKNKCIFSWGKLFESFNFTHEWFINWYQHWNLNESHFRHSLNAFVTQLSTSDAQSVTSIMEMAMKTISRKLTYCLILWDVVYFCVCILAYVAKCM